MNARQQSDFSKRLKQVCDTSPIVPEYGQGRQVFFAHRLKVTQEAVRKWFTGEAVPRQEKMRRIANILKVDVAWLALGVEPELTRKEKREELRKSDGAVYLLFGLFSLAGGYCAFPKPNDPRQSYVDFYAILDGTQIAVHVCAGRAIESGQYEFSIPQEYADVRCVGAVTTGPLTVALLDLEQRLIDKHKRRHGGGYEVGVSKIGSEYLSGADAWPQVASVHDLID